MKPLCSTKRSIWVLCSLLAALVLVPSSGVQTAFALPRDPIEPQHVGPPPVFKPPANGFTWQAHSRFGDVDSRGMVNFHWDGANYDPSYVNPTSFQLIFESCPTQDEETVAENGGTSTYSYVWQLDGTTVQAPNCWFRHSFAAQGTYPVTLTVTPPGGAATSYTQNVTVKDWLIVSIGDSFASGEGTPDIPQSGNTPAQWEDKRCHRSEFSGPAQAALQIEASDPHTSVTFLSFACSGATINTETLDGGNPLDINGDLTMARGEGLLGPYRGADVPKNFGYDPQTYLPAQVDALANTLQGRRIDALLVDGGGNDIGFANVIKGCLLYTPCQNQQFTDPYDANRKTLDQITRDAVQRLPAAYTALAQAISNPNPGTRSAINVSPSHVFITEYPDLTKDDSGNFCPEIVNDILPDIYIPGPTWWPPLFYAHFSMDQNEERWAAQTAFTPLNQAIANAASANGWNYVGGIAADFAAGHGYCARDNWVRRAIESLALEGSVGDPITIPLGLATIVLPNATLGTLHPTAEGYQDYAYHIVQSVASVLYGSGSSPTSSAPQFSTSLTAGSSTSLQGANGWVTGSCAGGTCSSSEVVESVAASDPTGIQGASVWVNGTPGCNVPGLSCSAGFDASGAYRWSFDATADGVYRLQFSVENGAGQVSTYVKDLKIDLHDPSAQATVTAGTLGNGGWYRSPVDVRLDASDPAGGSGLAGVTYTVDGGPGVTVSSGTSLHLPSDGTHTITYQSADNAGRTSPSQTLTVKIDATAPVITCAGPDGSWHAGDVSLACTADDNSGSGLASSSNANFSLSTGVPPGSETANAATGTHTVCDVAGNCATAGPISGNKVDRKPPTITISTPVSGTYTLSQTVRADYACTDGGSGVAACVGTVANENPIDTGSVGVKLFTVSAQDTVNNAASQIASYTVAYALCLLFDPTQARQSGSTLPITLQICDAHGTNVSSPSITLHASDVDGGPVQSPGNSQPGNNFNYDAGLGGTGGYQFNLKTTGLSSGSHSFNFTVAGDPTVHTIRFEIS